MSWKALLDVTIFDDRIGWTTPVALQWSQTLLIHVVGQNAEKLLKPT